MLQLSKVKTIPRAHIGHLSLGRERGRVRVVQRNGSVQPKPLTSVLSPPTGERRKSLDQGEVV
jgi:hypothetical protein